MRYLIIAMILSLNAMAAVADYTDCPKYEIFSYDNNMCVSKKVHYINPDWKEFN